jgi:hypothetical protein
VKYILVKQEDFDKLDCDNFDAGSIEAYKIGWDVKGLYFILWEKVMNFFKEKGITYKVMEL